MKYLNTNARTQVPENPTTRITSLTVDSATVVNTLRVPQTRVMLVTIVICVVLNRIRLILVRSVRVHVVFECEARESTHFNTLFVVQKITFYL